MAGTGCLSHRPGCATLAGSWRGSGGGTGTQALRPELTDALHARPAGDLTPRGRHTGRTLGLTAGVWLRAGILHLPPVPQAGCVCLHQGLSRSRASSRLPGQMSGVWAPSLPPNRKTATGNDSPLKIPGQISSRCPRASAFSHGPERGLGFADPPRSRGHSVPGALCCRAGPCACPGPLWSPSGFKDLDEEESPHRVPRGRDPASGGRPGFLGSLRLGISTENLVAPTRPSVRAPGPGSRRVRRRLCTRTPLTDPTRHRPGRPGLSHLSRQQEPEAAGAAGPQSQGGAIQGSGRTRSRACSRTGPHTAWAAVPGRERAGPGDPRGGHVPSSEVSLAR